MFRSPLLQIVEIGDMIRNAAWHALQAELRTRPGGATGKELNREMKESCVLAQCTWKKVWLSNISEMNE